jgi:single-strand DNA-binding protein
MASFNRVILLGNLTRDIELRYTTSGMAIGDAALAVNDRRKNQAGEWVDEATFVDVKFFGRTAEIAGEYLSKGSPVHIEGRLKLDMWEKDGQSQAVKREQIDLAEQPRLVRRIAKHQRMSVRPFRRTIQEIVSRTVRSLFR